MTVWDLVHAVRRQWALALVGLLVTLAGAYAASTAPGVYYQQTFVVFLPPEPRDANDTNALQNSGGSLVEAAGLVGRQVSARPQGPVPVSTRVTIVDLGIRNGALARLPNTAAFSQWSPSFDRPMLDVQIVGNSPEQVRATMTRVVSEIRRTLREGELATGSPQDRLIRTVMNPPTPPVFYQRGSSGRSVLASLVLGLGLTITLTVLVDRLRRSWTIRARTTADGTAAGRDELEAHDAAT
jgi:hypothetical protein